MKNTIIVIALSLFALIGAVYTFVRTREEGARKALALEAKAEADAAKAQAKKKTAEAEAVKARSSAAAEKRRAEAKQAEAEAAKAKAAEAEADRKAVADQKVLTEAAARKAEADKEKARAEADKAQAEADRIEAWSLAVQATNETRLAELRLAENARLLVEAEARQKEFSVKEAELKKQNLDRRLKEVAALEETLRQREEATRPERTIKNIIDENERRRAEEEAAAAEAEERRLAELREKDYAAYEAEMEKRRKINREGVAGPKAKDLTPADKILKAAEEARARTTVEGREALHARYVALLEPQLKQALREGRREDAEFILKRLLLLVSSYKMDDAGEKAAERKDGAEK